MKKTPRTVLIITFTCRSTGDYENLLQQDTEVRYRFVRESTDEQILALCQTHQIDVIILEFDRPDSSGIQVLNWLKTQMGQSCPPIVAVGIDDAEIAVLFLKAGAADYLVKERITPDKLCHCLQAAIANSTSQVQQHWQRQIESELKSQAIENLPVGAVFVVDRDLRYLLAEGEALYSAGFKPEDLVGRTIFEALPPELTSEYEKLYRQVLAGETFAWEHNAHGSTYMSRGTPLRDSEGEIYAGLVVSYDISEQQAALRERQQAEAALKSDFEAIRLLQDLSTRLVTENNIQVVYDEIMATAIALTRADAGTVQILEQETQELVLLATQGFEQSFIAHFDRVNTNSNTSCGIALAKSDRTFIDFDVPKSEDPDGSLRMHVEAGYYSAQSTPLICRSGKPIGMFSTHWRKHHRPTERELRFLDLLARQAADLIEQQRILTDLKESEAKYRSLFESIDEGYFLCEVIFDENDRPIDLFYIDENSAAVRMTGQSFRGQRLRDIDPNYEEYWYEICGRVAKTGQTERLERYAEPNGIWYDFFVFKVDGDDRGRVAVIFQDITNRKRREANLTFLADLMNDFAPLATAEEVMEMAGKRITEHLDLSRYMFVEIFPEAGTCTYLLPSHPPGQLEISGSFVLAEYHTEEEHRWLCAGHSMIVNDVRDGTRTPEQIAAFELFDISSIVNTPYLSNGRWVFDLGVARSKPSVWRKDEIELLRELSARVWLRIERARAETALRQSEEKYRSLFENINDGFCIMKMLYDDRQNPIDCLILETSPLQQTTD